MHIHRYRKRYPSVRPLPTGSLDVYGAVEYKNILHYVWACPCGKHLECRGVSLTKNNIVDTWYMRAHIKQASWVFIN